VFRTRRPQQGPAEFQLVGMKLPKGEPKVLMPGIYGRYSPTGHLLVVTAEGKLLAVPFDPDKLAVTGAPIGLLEGLGVEGGGFAVNLALSESGTLVYTTGGATASRRPVWVSRTGQETVVDPAWQPQGIINNFSLAQDGKALAVDVVQNGINAIWIKQLPSGPFSRLTFGDSSNMRPSWAADGRSIVYLAEVDNIGGTPVIRRADGTGSARELRPRKSVWGHAFETRDGRWIVLRSSVFEPGKGNIYGMRAGDTTLVPLVDGPATEGDPAVSPNGRWLAYASDESGASEIYVRPFPDASSARWQVSSTGGTDPVWSPDGRELFYIGGQNEMMRVTVAPGQTFTISPPESLFSTAPYSPIPPVPAFAVSPDGTRFLMLRETAAAERNELIVVQNWVEEMRQRARR
jgi:Periplasmic component of the Tol biopolymer transport system